MIATTTATTLTDQVGSTASLLPGRLLERARHEAMTVPRGWVTGYGEYQSGGWGTLSLLNETGDPRDVTIGDTDPVPTDLLRKMPATAELIGRLGLQVWWARLALMAPGSYLWEHRDYTEPGVAGTARHRVHVPLTTSSAAFLVTAGHAVHMAAGRIWRLDPVHVHGACNIAGSARIHLILDCHADSALNDLHAAEELPAECVRELPVAAPAELDGHARAATRLARLGYPREAETHLLRLYFTRVLTRDGYAYDMITDLHASLGDHETASFWRDRKALTLGDMR